MDKGKIKDIGYIDLDVEGMEYMILKGAKNLINKYRPIIRYEIQLDMDKNNAIKELLIKSDYKLCLMNQILPECRDDCRNMLAIPEENPMIIIDIICNYIYNYKICLHINNRCEILNFEHTKDSYYTFMLIKGGTYACLLVDKDNKVLNSYGIDTYVKYCENHCKSINARDDYFIELK